MPAFFRQISKASYRRINVFVFRVLSAIWLSNALTFAVAAQQSSPDLMDSPLTLSLAQTAELSGSDSILVIDQYGIHNTIKIIQASDSTNLVDVVQMGNNNSASIVQLGIGNAVELLQDGNDNGFEIVQEGDFNQANINQLGDQYFIVYQIGNDMVVNITQYKK